MKKQLEEATKQHQTELKTLEEEKQELEERLKDEMKTAGEEKQRLEKEFVKEKLKMEERLKEQDSLLTVVESEFEKLKASPKVRKLFYVIITHFKEKVLYMRDC